MSTTWASAVLSQDVCGLCGNDFAAAESRHCPACEQAMMQALIKACTPKEQRAMLDQYKRKANDRKFWDAVCWFGGAVVVLLALMEIFKW